MSGTEGARLSCAEGAGLIREEPEVGLFQQNLIRRSISGVTAIPKS
jgi:hypothetical protein